MLGSFLLEKDPLDYSPKFHELCLKLVGIDREVRLQVTSYLSVEFGRLHISCLSCLRRYPLGDKSHPTHQGIYRLDQRFEHGYFLGQLQECVRVDQRKSHEVSKTHLVQLRDDPMFV